MPSIPSGWTPELDRLARRRKLVDELAQLPKGQLVKRPVSRVRGHGGQAMPAAPGNRRAAEEAGR